MGVLAQRISKLEAAAAGDALPIVYISDRPHDDAEVERRIAEWRGPGRVFYDVADEAMSVEEWIRCCCGGADQGEA